MCKDAEEGAVAICLGREEMEVENNNSSPAPTQAPRKKTGTKPLKNYRILIRTPKVDTHIVLSASGQKELFESLRAVYPFADKGKLSLIEDPKFCDDMLSLDETMVHR